MGTILIYATDGTEGRVGDRSGRSSDEGAGGRRRVSRSTKVVKTTQSRVVVQLQEGNGRLAPRLECGTRAVSVTSRTSSIAATSPRRPRGGQGRRHTQGSWPDRPQAHPEAQHQNGNTVSPVELIERAKDAPPREPSVTARRATAIGAGGPGGRGRGGGRGRYRERSARLGPTSRRSGEGGRRPPPPSLDASVDARTRVTEPARSLARRRTRKTLIGDADRRPPAEALERQSVSLTLVSHALWSGVHYVFAARFSLPLAHHHKLGPLFLFVPTSTRSLSANFLSGFA